MFLFSTYQIDGRAIVSHFCINYFEIFNFSLATAACPSGWVMSASKTKCFAYIESSQSWNESETTCRNHFGHLAAVTSFQELSFVQMLCGNETAKGGCWIGGRGMNTGGGVGWKWSDDTSNWDETLISMGAPNLNSNCSNSSCANSDDFCTMVNNRTTSLVAERCNTSRAFICMRVIGTATKIMIFNHQLPQL